MSTKTLTKRKPSAPKTGSIKRAKGKARTLKDIKKTPTDDEVLAALDAESTETANVILADIEPAETIDKEGIYESQQSALTISGEADKSKSQTKNKPTSQRVRREIDMERLAEIYEEPQAMVDGIADLPVKVQDKARNALLAMTSDVRLSGYTQYTIEALHKGGTGLIESGMIREILNQRGYKDGTASAQAQQQMTLLPFLKVVKRDGRVLTAIEGEPYSALIARI